MGLGFRWFVRDLANEQRGLFPSLCTELSYFFPESLHPKPKLLSILLHLAPQLPCTLKVVEKGLRCSEWKPSPMQNPRIKLFGVGYDWTASIIRYPLYRQSQTLPTLDSPHPVTEMLANLFPAGQNHGQVF